MIGYEIEVNLSVISFNGQTAMVTGASRGIGRATAILLAQLGADIIIHFHKNREKAIETSSIIEGLGRKSYLVQGNLANQQEIRAIFATIEKKVNRIDILVNNAGIIRKNFLRFTSEEQWDDVIDTNLKGTFLCSKYASKIMMGQKSGCIINVSSIVSMKPQIQQSSYSASKGGINALTKTLAKELGRFKIRVNAVAPGPIRTDMNNFDDDEEEKVRKLIPLERIGECEEVAKVIAFLASPMAEYVTGQIIIVDGGFSL